MHASTRPGSRWRTGRCVHGQSPVWDAALQRPVISETARESCFAQNKGAPVEYSTRRITTRTAGAPTHCRCRCRKQRAHVRHASTRCPLLAVQRWQAKERVRGLAVGAPSPPRTLCPRASGRCCTGSAAATETTRRPPGRRESICATRSEKEETEHRTEKRVEARKSVAG